MTSRQRPLLEPGSHCFQTILTDGIKKWGEQTLEATGNTVRHEIINQNCTGEQCTPLGRKKKKKKKKDTT